MSIFLCENRKNSLAARGEAPSRILGAPLSSILLKHHVAGVSQKLTILLFFTNMILMTIKLF